MIKVGMDDPKYAHILSFRRYFFGYVGKDTELPDTITINYEEDEFRIQISTEIRRCNKCSQTGHIAENCPQNNDLDLEYTQTSTNTNANVLPTSENSRGSPISDATHNKTISQSTDSDDMGNIIFQTFPSETSMIHKDTEMIQQSEMLFTNDPKMPNLTEEPINQQPNNNNNQPPTLFSPMDFCENQNPPQRPNKRPATPTDSDLNALFEQYDDFEGNFPFSKEELITFVDEINPTNANVNELVSKMTNNVEELLNLLQDLRSKAHRTLKARLTRAINKVSTSCSFSSQ